MRISGEEIKALTNVALGKEKADLVIKGGTLLNVYTAEMLPNYDVAIKGERIAYVGPNAGHTIGDKTEVINAGGKTLVPGFIESHTHLDVPLTMPENWLPFSILTGTTTIIMETGEVANLGGYEAVQYFLDLMHRQPIKFFTLAPMWYLAASPPAVAEASLLGIEESERILEEAEDGVGLGEIDWQSVLNGNDALYNLLAKALNMGKKPQGHGAGARGNRLQALAAAGISSCHEAVTAEQALERLRLGIYAMVREGSIRRELEAISAIQKEKVDLRRLILVSDGLMPGDLLEYGHMNYLVEKAIALGFDPIKAVQMVTLNPAEHFSIDSMVGGIAPGKYADILVLPDLEKIRPEVVISKGRIVAREGKLLVDMAKIPPPQGLLHTVRFPRPILARDFAVPHSDHASKLTVRVIELADNTITREGQAELPLRDGFIQADPDHDVLRVSLFERFANNGRGFTAFTRGFGLKSGAFASSYSWENRSPLVVVGADEEDMALAVNRLAEIGGGLIVCHKGKILKEFPLPVLGLLSDQPARQVVEGLAQIKRAVEGLGCGLPNPVLTLQIFPCTLMPFFRMSLKGMVDVKTGRVSDMVVR